LRSSVFPELIRREWGIENGKDRFFKWNQLTEGRREAMDVYAEIRGMIAKELALEEKEIVPDADLQDDLGADSLGLLSLSEAIAARYGIELIPDDLIDARTVGELARLIDSRISSKG
jgi:acyl carrier protein